VIAELGVQTKKKNFGRKHKNIDRLMMIGDGKWAIE
jgi:hypothetical protein